jgi:hypothetical protein
VAGLARGKNGGPRSESIWAARLDIMNMRAQFSAPALVRCQGGLTPRPGPSPRDPISCLEGPFLPHPWPWEAFPCLSWPQVRAALTFAQAAKAGSSPALARWTFLHDAISCVRVSPW